MKKFALGIALMGSIAATPVNATVYDLVAKATVNGLTLSENGNYTPYAGGSISIGDTVLFTMRFDTSKAVVTNLYNADPTINIYDLYGATASLIAGNYQTSFSPAVAYSGLRLWDNYVVSSPVDMQTFEISNYDYQGNPPFSLGNGRKFEMMQVQSFDFSALARSNDLASDLVASSDAFGSNSLTYYYSVDADPIANTPRRSVFVNTGNVSWALNAAAVPEPATWAMMILGMGVIGYAMRRRKKAATVRRLA